MRQESSFPTPQGQAAPLVRPSLGVRRRPAKPKYAASLILALCTALGVGACGGGGNQYAAAAVGLGATIAATAAYRSVTGGCWASCGQGLTCDRATGLCVRGECAPGCPVGQHCVREPNDEDHCVDDALSTSFGSAPQVPVSPKAPGAPPDPEPE